MAEICHATVYYFDSCNYGPLDNVGLFLIPVFGFTGLGKIDVTCPLNFVIQPLYFGVCLRRGSLWRIQG